MAVSYKKLWKLLIDKDMKKKDLCEKAGISPASVTKMGRNGHVTTEILLKICTALDCGVEDIMEIVADDQKYCGLRLFQFWTRNCGQSNQSIKRNINFQ